MKIEEIRELMSSFEASGILKMEVNEKDFSLKLEKAEGQTLQPAPAVKKQEADKIDLPKAEEEQGTWIQSPLVGTFYAARSASSKPFVEIGQKVKKGDVLCIIEAMKVMNEIHAPHDGVIRSILVTNASMVEFDQKLIRIGEDQ